MNPTRALILKDLRLSLDALVPWALIVIGLTLLALVLRALPTSRPWLDLSGAALGDFLFILGVIVGGSAPIVSAWSTGAIVHGDRSHGAATLMGWSPVSESSRVLGKSIAIVAAALSPAAIGVLLAGVGMTLQGRSLMQASDFAYFAKFVLIGTTLATGLMLAASPLSRTTRSTLVWAFVIGILASVAGAIGHFAGAGPALADYSSVIDGVPAEPWEREILERDIRISASAALAVATITGAVLASAVGGATGLWSISRPRRRRALIAGLCLMPLGALVGGAVASRLTIEREFVRHSRDPIWTWRLASLRLSDAELIAELEKYRAIEESRADLGTHEQWQAATLVVFEPQGVSGHAAEARRRVLALPEQARAQHPLARALRSARDLSTAERARTTMDWPVESEESTLAFALDAVARYPEDRALRMALRWKLGRTDALNQGSCSPTVPWPLIASITPPRSERVGEPAFGSPLWAWRLAWRLNMRRWDDLDGELRRLTGQPGHLADPAQSDRIAQLEREIERLRTAKPDPAALEAAAEQDLLLLLRRLAASTHPAAERGAVLADRFEALGAGEWKPLSGGNP